MDFVRVIVGIVDYPLNACLVELRLLHAIQDAPGSRNVAVGPRLAKADDDAYLTYVGVNVSRGNLRHSCRR
jgi:hypothetical protein